MTTPTRALILDLRVQQAENNLRRNTASFGVNYPAEDESAYLASFSIAPTASISVDALSATPAVLVVRTSGPLAATLERDTNVDLTINKLLVWDSTYTSLTLQNNGAEDVKVTITQG